MARQWKKDQQDEKPFAPIVPVLFCHTGRKWEYQTFSALFPGVPGIFLEFIPNFRYVLHDLTDREIQGGLLIRLAQILMKAATGGQMREKLPEIMRLLPGVMERGERWAEIFLLYMLKAGDLDHEELLREFRKVKFKYGEEWIMTTAERLLEEGRKQGLEKGIEQGKLVIAGRLLEKNFSLEDVLEATGLTREELESAGMI